MLFYDDKLTLSLLLGLFYGGGWGLSKLQKSAGLICGGRYPIFDTFLYIKMAMFYCLMFSVYSSHKTVSFIYVLFMQDCSFD